MGIRDVVARDEAAWRELWGQYLAFYGVTLDAAVTDQTWARLIDPAAPLRGRVAEVEGEVLGFALHHTHLSTWVAAPDCYLEDLFLTEAARGHGLGRALLDDLVAICRANGNARLYWHTDEGNSRARALYDSYAPYDGHVRYRLKL